MPVKVCSYGGPVIWMLRKRCSALTSKVMLSVASKCYERTIKEYIDYFFSKKEIPLFTYCMIETINRCNGSCAFCPANRSAESRPYKRMPDELFERILDQLCRIRWAGTMFLNVNNEPFLDKRTLQFAGRAKEKLIGVRIAIISNGTLLTPRKLDEMVGLVDEIVINDYGESYQLSSSHKALYEHVKRNRAKFTNMSVTINRRYCREILATRAGAAPNKPKKNNRVNGPCIYPFTDIVIFPDGKVGMCCNDCFEETDFGDLTVNSLSEIWRGEKFTQLRKAMAKGRSAYSFCGECDVVDAGGREKTLRTILANESGKEKHGGL